MLLLKRFLFVAAITLPFDIKDIGTDRSWGLVTLATRLGARGSCLLALFFLVAYVVLLWGFHLPGQPASFYGLLITALLAAVLILYSLKQRKDFFYLFIFAGILLRSEEHTSELQSLMPLSYTFLFL